MYDYHQSQTSIAGSPAPAREACVGRTLCVFVGYGCGIIQKEGVHPRRRPGRRASDRAVEVLLWAAIFY